MPVVVAVGYTIDTLALHGTIVKVAKLSEVDELYLEDSVHTGVWFNQKCPGLGDCRLSETELKSWYQKRKDRQYTFRVTTLHIDKNNTKVAAEIHHEGDHFLSFVYNRKRSSTTYQKKAILSGQQGWRSVTLPEPVKLQAVPYIFEQEKLQQ